MIRLTKSVRNGLTEMAAICETILEVGGEGWALECRTGPDHGPCRKPTCDTCRNYDDLARACGWVREFVAKKGG